MSASPRLLRLHLPAGVETPDTVDVFFDDQRVWSTALRRSGTRASARWPRPLVPYLRGDTEIRVTDSATGTVLAEGPVSFPGPGRVEVVDARGRRLAMNKWDRLGPTMEGDASGIQERLLRDAVDLVARLEDWGYPVYIVGGTLLGALRTGRMLPHDDDMDVAWLCEATTLTDASLESLQMERRLVEAGFTVLRLGLAHLQVTYLDDRGYIGHYVDIFTGFYDDGLYNQPFALRGPLARDQLVPVSHVDLNGVSFPAPARPEGWLEFAYGPSWLVPDPSFKFEVDPATKRLFEATLGVYNRQRVWWEKFYEEMDEPSTGTAGFDVADRFLELLPAGSRVVDLGCGDGRISDHLAAAGHEVTAYDYAYEALRLARSFPSLDVHHLNLNNRRDAIRVGLDLAASGDDVWFFAHELLHCVPPNGRESLYVLLRGVLNDRTRAYLTFFSDPHPDRDDQNPNTWHIDLARLSPVLRTFGLSMYVLDSRQVDTLWGERTLQEAVLWR